MPGCYDSVDLGAVGIGTVGAVDISRWRSRLPVTRASDGELVGWTVSDLAADDGELVDAVNPVGHVIAADVELGDAVDVLESQGLSSLCGRTGRALRFRWRANSIFVGRNTIGDGAAW